MDAKITLSDLRNYKADGQKFSALSCYDYTTARLAASAEIELLLVGDSAAQHQLGLKSTLPVTMDYMVAITCAVFRAADKRVICADMPFLSYQTGTRDAILNAGRFLTEANADIVKVEAAFPQIPVIKALAEADIPVMSHIGIRPQSIAKASKLKAQARDAASGAALITLADRMVEAGADMLLLEGVAREVAAVITRRSTVPVISCGSGPDCDGQVLIAHDILGLSEGSRPKFAKVYKDLSGPVLRAFEQYHQDVKTGKFPDDDHSYHVEKSALDSLKDICPES